MSGTSVPLFKGTSATRTGMSGWLSKTGVSSTSVSLFQGKCVTTGTSGLLSATRGLYGSYLKLGAWDTSTSDKSAGWFSATETPGLSVKEAAALRLISMVAILIVLGTIIGVLVGGDIIILCWAAAG